MMRAFNRSTSKVAVDMGRVDAVRIGPDGSERVVSLVLSGGTTIVVFDSLNDGGRDEAERLFRELAANL